MRIFPPGLVPRLLPLFGELTHVRDVGLKQADDEQIWAWAKVNGYSILTADVDFATLGRRLGWPPKVVHLEHCDFPLRVIEDLLRRSAVRIAEFDGENQAGFLAIRLRPEL